MSKQIHNTLTPPFQWLCSIETTYAKRVVQSPGKPASSASYVKFGTGILITNRHILTCAHNVSAIYKYKRAWLSTKPIKIRVKVGRNDEGRSAKAFWYRAKLPVSVPLLFANYRNSATQDARYDYAVIELKSPVGDKTFLRSGKRRKIGWWSTAHKSYIRPIEGSFKAALRKKKINVCGYPGHADPGGENDTTAGIPMIDFVSVTGVGTNTRPLMTFNGDVSEGQSGGPIWVVDRTTSKRYLVALYVGTDNNTGAQLGRLITPDVIDELQSWGISKRRLALSQTPSVN